MFVTRSIPPGRAVVLRTEPRQAESALRASIPIAGAAD